MRWWKRGPRGGRPQCSAAATPPPQAAPAPATDARPTEASGRRRGDPRPPRGAAACAAVAAEARHTRALGAGRFAGKPTKRAALCERFGVANAHRTLHGALLDAQLLAEVYLAMTRGQESLTIDIIMPRAEVGEGLSDAGPVRLILIRASAEELAAHHAYLVELDRGAKGACLWLAPAGA